MLPCPTHVSTMLFAPSFLAARDSGSMWLEVRPFVASVRVIWADRAVRRAVGYCNLLKKSSLGPPDKREVGSSTLPRPIGTTQSPITRYWCDGALCAEDPMGRNRQVVGTILNHGRNHGRREAGSSLRGGLAWHGQVASARTGRRPPNHVTSAASRMQPIPTIEARPGCRWPTNTANSAVNSTCR